LLDVVFIVPKGTLNPYMVLAKYILLSLHGWICKLMVLIKLKQNDRLAIFWLFIKMKSSYCLAIILETIIFPSGVFCKKNIFLITTNSLIHWNVLSCAQIYWKFVITQKCVSKYHEISFVFYNSKPFIFVFFCSLTFFSPTVERSPFSNTCSFVPKDCNGRSYWDSNNLVEGCSSSWEGCKDGVWRSLFVWPSIPWRSGHHSILSFEFLLLKVDLNPLILVSSLNIPWHPLGWHHQHYSMLLGHPVYIHSR